MIVGSEKLDALHPAFRGLAKSIVYHIVSKGIGVAVVSTLRTFEEQEKLYQKGGVTKAPPGRSWHNYGLAMDLAPLKNGVIDWNDTPLFQKMGEIVMARFRPNGIVWGGEWQSFKDWGHFEWHPGLTIDTALQFLKSGYIWLPR